MEISNSDEGYHTSLNERSNLNTEDAENDDFVNKQTDKDNTNEALKRITDLTSDDIRGLEFDSEDKAYEFYKSYAKCHGFAVRKDDIGRNSKGEIIKRRFVCSREGLRDKKHLERVDRIREHKLITRTDCPARFRVYLDYMTSRWKVAEFEGSHNHELTPQPFIHLIPSYRLMSDADKAQVDSLHLYGVRTCHIMGLMLGQKGGHSDLGFCKKDLYNHVDKQKRAKIEDGDAFAALCYLQAKADNDPMLFAKFTTTDDGRLQHLFWSDGGSRTDYDCFGDVVAFDTTYKKNKYNKPLVIFCGYNHHGETTIFGCALVDDEKTETYKWVLEAFSEAMSHKHPIGIVTDGDNAMREAVKAVFPNASHRLCAWHLQRNAAENVKNPKFLKEFEQLMYNNYWPHEFEVKWNQVIENYSLSTNDWAQKTYERKRMWATAYMRDKLFCGIRTTSICEGINSFIKRYVQSKNSLVDFMHNFERAVKEYRQNELMSDFNSVYGFPVMTTSLHKLELGAAKIFTKNKFKEVKDEIKEVMALNVIERLVTGNSVTLKMNKFCNTDSEYVVVVNKDESRFLCDCRLFETHGIPCSHIFCSMKHEHMDVIPNSLICKRWTKEAKLAYITSVSKEQVDSDKMVLLRTGALSASCNRMCNLAASDTNDFLEIREEIHKLITKLENRRNGNSEHSASANVIGDPTMVKTKGAPRKKKYDKKRRHCSNCNKVGHNKSKCPLLAQGNGGLRINEEAYSEPESNTQLSASHEQNNVHVASPMHAPNAKEKGPEGKVNCARKRKRNSMCTPQISTTKHNTQDRLRTVQIDSSIVANQCNGMSNAVNYVPNLQSGPSATTQTLPTVFSTNLPSFPQFPAVPTGNNKFPPIPTYNPQNQPPHIFTNVYTNNLPLFPQSSVGPMGTTVIPHVPTYNNQTRPFTSYPQYFGFRHGDSSMEKK